ncbi:MAG: response regulator [Deltaproteobacteria bacterium]|nr:response regulator [Deltaproteobacteria bacterium]
MRHRFATVGSLPTSKRLVDLLTALTETIPADNAATAARLLDEQGVTAVLVFADLGTPEGCRAAGRVLTDTALTAVPVVVVSRRAGLDRRLDALRLGAGAVLDDNVDFEGIERALGEGPEDARIEPMLDRSQRGALRRCLALLEAERFDGVVGVTTADAPAELGLVEGRVVRAECGALRGQDAVAEVLAPATTVLDFKVVASASVAPAPKNRTEGVSVLLIDDDPVGRHLFRAFLSHAGFTVTDAADAESGLAKARALRPDVVVTDLHMPRIDGWRVIAELRGDPATADARIVLHSAFHELLDQLTKAGVGADAFVKKDGRARHLIDVVSAQGAARVALRSALKLGVPFTGSTRELTLGALLHELAAAGTSAKLVVDDGIAHVELVIDQGEFVDAHGRSAAGEWSGRAALALALSLHPATMSVTLTTAAEHAQREPLQSLVDRIRSDDQTHVVAERHQRLADDAPLAFDEERLRAYKRRCTPEARPVVAALHDGTSPRALVAAGHWDPMMVDDIVADLMQRGVARAVRTGEMIELEQVG